MIPINEYAKQIYEQNVEAGWWDDPNRCLLLTLQLVLNEIAEANEGDRRDLQDDHLPHRDAAEVELADVLIRLLDLAGRYGWKFVGVDVDPNLFKVGNLAAKHFILSSCVCRLGLVCMEELSGLAINIAYSKVIVTLMQIVADENYDIKGAVDEKLEYNKKRADHKRKNRKQPGGKRY